MVMQLVKYLENTKIFLNFLELICSKYLYLIFVMSVFIKNLENVICAKKSSKKSRSHYFSLENNMFYYLPHVFYYCTTPHFRYYIFFNCIYYFFCKYFITSFCIHTLRITHVNSKNDCLQDNFHNFG